MTGRRKPKRPVARSGASYATDLPRVQEAVVEDARGVLADTTDATVSIDVGRCVICLAGEDLSLSSFGADWMTAAETMGFVFVRLAPKPVQSLRVAHLLIARSGRRRGVLWNATALVTA